jgi:N-glycosylase/DNA lyase
MVKPDLPKIKKPDNLQRLYSIRKRDIRRRLREFRDVKPDNYFYELVYCLLTPQSSASNAFQVVEELRLKNFRNADFNPEPFLSRRDCYVRFHRTKAKHLLTVRHQYPEIKNMILSNIPGNQMRQWLVKNVMGMGWKEASHFLRNIGYHDLAILDRHILRNLRLFGVIRIVPKALTLKKYLQIEKKFRNFSNKCGIPMDELDLLFWSMGTGKILK